MCLFCAVCVLRAGVWSCVQLQMTDLDDRNIAELSKFDAAVALEILEVYSSGDLSQVRNRRAYLAGVEET